jgi:hypothetical protein
VPSTPGAALGCPSSQAPSASPPPAPQMNYQFHSQLS